MSDCRRVILCISNLAIYFIKDFEPENDKVSISSRNTSSSSSSSSMRRQERIFPSAIPNSAKFKDALWPHAFARHPFDFLTKISIGFSFQRLLIHFRQPNGDEYSEYTYIIFTGTKKRTIELLNQIQSSANYLDDGKQKDIFIDNEDIFFLDAFGEAISPEPLGTILHYQILRQKWKQGDREDVRRICILTEENIYLLDENYIGDGSTITTTTTTTTTAAAAAADTDAMVSVGRENLMVTNNPFDDDDEVVVPCSYSTIIGNVKMKVVDSAPLWRISEVRAAVNDPRLITLVIKAPSKMSRPHRWRLICTDGESAERLVFDVRNATADMDNI